MTRKFEDHPAVRERVPLLLGLMGPSGGGKTFSALRLARGIQTVNGGDIFVIDTEANRAKHYADEFQFRHVPFAAPFSPRDYLAALQHCSGRGAGVIVVDSMSHEHEGPGGVLSWHAAEVERLSRGDAKKAERVKMLAWAAPKQARRELITGISQMPVSMIFCFRAKKKIKIVRGQEPQELGWMPIAGEEFVFEMIVCALLMPGANGVPTWNPSEDGERQMVKLPGWARDMISKQLDEETGERLARWAAGDLASAPTETKDAPTVLIGAYKGAAEMSAFEALEKQRRAMWPRLNATAKRELKAAADAAAERISTATAPPASDEKRGDQ